jgi:hypothetical protein
MQLASYVEALQRDLAAVAAAGDARTGELVSRLSSALQASLRLRLLEAVSEAAREVSAQLPEGRVEVRLGGTDPSLVYAEEPRSRAADGDNELSARISLRLPESLKTRIEAAATQESLSVNSWTVAALARAAEERQRRMGKRLTGFARS